jgi:CBS domain-containing protein
VVNFVIAGALFVILAGKGTPPHGSGFFIDLAWVNVMLGLFNLVPAFPMDGGRILRGALSLRMPYLAATRRARDVGQLIALVFATIAFVNASFLALALIATFVFAGGIMEERMVRTRARLTGRSVGQLAEVDAPVFAMDERVEQVCGRLDGRPAYAVAATSGALAGVVTASDLVRALRDGRAANPLATIARADFPVAEAATEAARVYRYLAEQRAAFAAVVDGDRFVGLFHAEEGAWLQHASSARSRPGTPAPRTAA